MSQNYTEDIEAIGRIEAVTRILEVVCRSTGMGFSAVARVSDSHWIACAVRDEINFGLKPGGELVLDTTICDEIRRSGELVVIDDVEADEQYRCHATPKRYGFRSYISVPIVLADGKFFGTLCAIDPSPAHLKKTETVEMFKLFASLIAFHLDAQLELIAAEKALLNEREGSQLREQFIAVLGHDLRNPLGAIRMGTLILTQTIQDEEDIDVCRMIDRSVDRMTELIENVMDFARGRLGGGLTVELKDDSGLEGTLRQVVQELESAWPKRSIHRDIEIARSVFCNSARLGQMLSNLLANALTHGDPASPVQVRAKVSTSSFDISVTNRGPTIPPEVIEQLFRPFVRGSAKPGQQGLGLGLYIASEIARAHNGVLEAKSADGETCFTFRMPLESR